MRDPARISVILQAVEEVWQAEPDLRLGQLLICAVKPHDPCPDLFYIEDEELLAKLQRHQSNVKMPTENSVGNE